MADIRALIFCCIALTSINLSSSSEIPKLDSDLEIAQLNMSRFGFPQFPGFGSGFPSLASFFGGGRKRRDAGFQIPNLNMSGVNFPKFPQPPGFDSMPSLTSFFEGDRWRRDTEAEPTNNDGEHQDRFFSHFSSITSCNTTTQGGRSCLNCRQALNCLSNNFGLLTTCRGLFQYCDQGRCVFNRPSNCTG